MFLSDAAIKNRTTVGVLVVLIILVGAQSYIALPREGAPDVPTPYILVSTAYEGVSPEDMESSVTMKIEKELSGLKGLDEMSSSSAEGLSVVVCEFLPDVKIEDALQRVRDRVDLAKSDLPGEAEEPTIKEINIAEFPILMVSISGTISPVRLKVVADDLEDAIQQLPGVLSIDMTGELEREIRIEIDQDRLAAYTLTIPELLALIPSENVNISAGDLETEGVKFNVRVPAEFVDPAEVDHLLLTIRDGKPIYLSDVAKVKDTFKDRNGYARLNGRPSITLAVRKRIGANVVHLADGVRMVLAEFRKTAPAGVDFDITLDQSKYIRAMVADLENNILSGLVLVVAVLFLFLGFRTSAIVALAIPLSMLISFAVILALGYTLNMIVLFGLVLALGMYVDNAIVIVENIYRHMQLGYGRIRAAMAGAAEVAWPVIASTATTIAAFLPLLFWSGMMGDFMKYLPITLIIALSSSLFVALVISPTICSLVLSPAPRQRKESGFIRGYSRVLRVALAHRFTTLFLAVTLLVGLGLLYLKQGAGVEFFPKSDPDNAAVSIRSPQGTNVRESDRLAMLVEERLKPYQKDIDYVVTNVGTVGESIGFMSGGGGGPHVADVNLVFIDYVVRERPSAEVVAGVRRDVSDIAGAEVTVKEEEEGPRTGAPVTVRIIGENFKVLEVLSDQAKRMIADVPGLVNLQSDLEAARPELVFKVDRQRAMLLNLNTATIGRFLKTAVFGTPVGTYREFNDEYDITIRLPLAQRVNIDDLLRLRVLTNSGEAVPLSSLGEFEYSGGLGTISRIDQQRVVSLTADAEGRLDNEVLADVESRLAKLELPPGYSIEYAGQKEEQEKAQAFLSRAYVIALLLIVLILVAQFNSLLIPIIIMSTVVLSLIGVLSGLLICHLPFGVIMTGIGVISLAGVVVNNAIVLLDYTRKLQKRGLDLIEAVSKAGKTRLRPVLLTAVTTILSLVPMATGVSFDFHVFEWSMRSQMSQFWQSMAVAVIFGLAFATVLTLIVVPTLYASLYGLAARFGFGGLRKKSVNNNNGEGPSPHQHHDDDPQGD